MASEKTVTVDPPETIRERRVEVRCAVVLPLRLTSRSGETIPAVILNLSATGLLALIDVRSFPLLPPSRGSRFEGEFFFDELEVRRVLLEVMRVDKRSTHLIALGCRFAEVPFHISTALRTKVASRLTDLRSWQTVSVPWQSASHDNS